MKRFFRIASAIVSLSLCLAMATLQVNAVDISSATISLDLAAGSVEVYESEGVTYCVQNGATQATTGGVILRQTYSGTTVTSNTVTVSKGNCNLTIAGLNIEATARYSSPIFVKADTSLELNLVGSNTVKGGNDAAGIEVSVDAQLTISGAGTVTASGGQHGAGIGGGYKGDNGIITIHGGTVTAISGRHGAGIGGGIYGNGGTITINGGTITATGSEAASGIGSGWQGSECTVTINGGTVTANGGSSAAGIGGGFECSGGTVTINGGTITATGGYYHDDYYDYYTDIGCGDNGIFDAVTIRPEAAVTNGKGEPPTVEETIFIDKQPLSAAALLSNKPLLTLETRSNSGLSYQWQVSADQEEWTDLENETSVALSNTVLTEELLSNYFRCKLTNGWGNVVYTDTAQLYVLTFAQQPASVEADLNDMVVFEAISTCPNVTYQWQRSYDEGENWSDVPGEIYSTLIVNATLSESSAKYRCIITATNGDQLASDVVSVNLDLGDLVTYIVQDFLQEVDGSYTMTSQQVLEGLSGTTVTAPEVSYDGFTLNTRKSILSGTVAEDSSLVLARYFDRETYAITFDTNGGSALPDLEALYEADIVAPSAPSRYGHTFAGWYADEDLTEKYTFDTMPLGGTTVYAKWEPVGADRGVEYKINDLLVRDSSTFELLDGITDGHFLVEVSITNLESTQVDTILLAYYTNSGQMIGMNYMFANLPVGYTATFGASVDNRDGSIGIVRAFVLPSLGNPVPLAESKSIN